MRWLSGTPLLLILSGITALAMYLPAAHALILRQHAVARAFFYSGTVLMFLIIMVALAVGSQRRRHAARELLAVLVGAYLILPLAMALPFTLAVPDTSFANAWFEMLSSFTTTGATLYAPERLPPSVHLWRAMAGWGGGFFIMLMAVAVLAPMNLGGVEVLSARAPGRAATGAAQITQIADPRARVLRYLVLLFPAYGLATLALWLGLVIAGEPSFIALVHAMGTLSTSGISAVGGLGRSEAGFAGEVMMLLCLIPALSRRAMPGQTLPGRSLPLWREPELQVACAIVLAVAAAVFLRRYAMALELQGGGALGPALHSLWGAIFTAVSFLTTTGYESHDWVAARAWSGLGTPGLLLLGLAITGGGVGTAAGGVKLLRIYALTLHGQRELERIVHPASVAGGGPVRRHLRNEGAYVAWIFFMLFAISIGVVVMALALALPNDPFDKLLILAIGALTTTGQLADLAADMPIRYGDLNGWAKAILGAGMVVGRMETLAILALLVPDGWQRRGANW